LSRQRTLVIVALLLGVSACASLDRQSADTAFDAGAAERQILVMLRLAPPHFRPDSNYAGSYDSRFGDLARRRMAQELASERNLTLIADWPMPALGVDCFVMQIPAGDSAARLAELLSRDARVEWAQPVNLFHTLGHNDPLYSLQPSARQWHLDALHKVSTGRDVVVAEIDTGVELDHPDLRGQVALARNFVDGSAYAGETHGTAVAGIIVARADNGVGIAGMAPQATLIALRACWQESGDDGAALCSTFTLAKALQFALARNAQIINLSLGGPRDRLLERLLDAALALGITIVGAVGSGNGGDDFPGSHAGVLAVALDDASNATGNVLLAPGRDVPTTMPGGRWGFVTGASFAAAHVTGMVALLRELVPQLRPQQVRAALSPAETRGAPAQPLAIDACAIISRAAGTGVCARTSEARSSLIQ
jgi:Subtilase family